MRNRGTQGIIGTPTASAFGVMRRSLNYLISKTLSLIERIRHNIKTKFYDRINKMETFESLMGFLRHNILVIYRNI
jgi:hypothetical protein